MILLSPTGNPCGSCPYRRDVPSGIWAEEEYDKLPAYDLETFAQPHGVFMCHQQTGRLCAGWCAVHDMEESLAIRIATATGRLNKDNWAKVVAYNATTPLFASGAEAAAHGKLCVPRPDYRASLLIAKLVRSRRIIRKTKRKIHIVSDL